MKYAIINGVKTEAYKGGSGNCPSCNSNLVAKCGEINIHHWAHKGSRSCDHWWENETEWHRQWKNHFPIEWQEVVQIDKNGEKHIADVKTESDWVLEFQHSYIKPEERRSRNTFYSKLVWVIDGLRRKTDKLQFQKILKDSSKAPIRNVNIRRVNFPEESRLLKEWLDCGVPVFFDFKAFDESGLWFLLPLHIEGEAYLIPFSRQEFIKVHNSSGFDELINEIIPNIRNILISHYKSTSNRSSNNLLRQTQKRPYRRRL